MIIGCGPIIKDVETPESGKAIVFGKIEIVTGDGVMDWRECGFGQMAVCPDEFELLLVSDNGTEPLRYKLKSDGSFVWNLLPGHYTIAEFLWIKYAPKRTRSGRVWAEFDVSDSRSTLYLGTLVLLFTDGRYLIGVKDDFDKQIEVLHSKLGRGGGPTTVSHFSLDKQYTNPASSDICEKQWGIGCTNSIRGVIPIFPLVTSAERFTTIDTLQPVLKWQPSIYKDVTYDVAIYEAVKHQKDFATVIYMPGKIVEYKEGLREASYPTTKQLRKETKYFWSVRLRRDGTVTHWSTEKYSSVGIVPGVIWVTKGEGKLYGFSTP